MKNLFKSMMLVAAAATGFAACSNDATEEFVNPEVKGATKTITVSTDITRTQFGADRTELAWSDDDEFGVFTDVAADKNLSSGTYASATDGAYTLEVSENATMVYAYYPYYKDNSSKSATGVNFGVPGTQQWSGPGILYGKNIPMVASGAIDGSNVSLTFKRIACTLALNIYGGKEGETLQSITFTTEENCAGRMDLDITGDEIAYEGNTKSVVVTPYKEAVIPVDAAAVADKQTFENQTYLTVVKKSYAAGATFVVKTSENTYTFTTKKALDCSVADFMPVNLDLTKGETPEPPAEDEIFVKINSLNELTDGEYVITGIKDGTYYALPVPTSSLAKISGEAVTVNDDQIAAKDAVGKVWTLEKNGDYYSLYSGNTYLYHSNGGNSGTDLASGAKQTYPWNISYVSNVFKFAGVTGTDVKTRGILFNTNTTQFGGYALSNITNTGYCGITLFKKVKVEAPDPNKKKLTIDSFITTLNTDKTTVAFEGSYTSNYDEEPEWSISVSKDGIEIGTVGDVIGVDGEIAADDYTVTEDGTYTFTLTATINGEIIASETTEVRRNTATNDPLWITNIADVTAGRYYIATPDGHLYNGAIKSGHLQVTGTAAKVANDGIVSDIPSGAVVVTFTATGTTNQYQLKDANGKYINVTKAGSGSFALGTSLSTSWTFSNSGNGLVAIGNNYKAHFRAYNNGSFRSYDKDNGTEIYLVKID